MISEKYMHFYNGVFEQGKRLLTVRQGHKWHNMLSKNQMFTIVDMDGSAPIRAKSLGTEVRYFNLIDEDELKISANPECRTKKGLTHNMKITYMDFSEREDVSMVYFEVCE